MENVVQIEDLPNYIKDTLLGIQKGLALANEQGAITTDPEMEVQFSCLVVGQNGWQALDAVQESSSTGEEKQGGGVTETTTSNGTNNSSTKDTTENSDTIETSRSREDKSSGSNKHAQNSDEEGQSSTSE